MAPCSDPPVCRGAGTFHQSLDVFWGLQSESAFPAACQTRAPGQSCSAEPMAVLLEALEEVVAHAVLGVVAHAELVLAAAPQASDTPGPKFREELDVVVARTGRCLAAAAVHMVGRDHHNFGKLLGHGGTLQPQAEHSGQKAPLVLPNTREEPEVGSEIAAPPLVLHLLLTESRRGVHPSWRRVPVASSAVRRWRWCPNRMQSSVSWRLRN